MSKKLSLIFIVCVSLTALLWADDCCYYYCTVIADGPLSYWRFEDTDTSDGATCTDTMGLVDGVYRNSGGGIIPGIAPVPSPCGQAAEFHGTNGGVGNFIIIPDNGSTGDRLTNTSMSIELLMLTTADSSNYPMIVNYHDWSGGPQLSFGDYSGPPLQTFQPYVTACSSTWYAWPPGILGDGNWHHYAVTFDYNDVEDITTAKIYMDSMLKGTHAFAGAIVPNTTDTWKDILLGAAGSPFYVYNGYVGYMDEVAIYDYALSKAQISSRFLFDDCPGDLNYDEKVDFEDFAELGSGWQTVYDIDTLAQIAYCWLALVEY
jgi:hypothetical protein